MHDNHHCICRFTIAPCPTRHCNAKVPLATILDHLTTVHSDQLPRADTVQEDGKSPWRKYCILGKSSPTFKAAGSHKTSWRPTRLLMPLNLSRPCTKTCKTHVAPLAAR